MSKHQVMIFQLYQDDDGKWYWRARGRNKRVVANCAQGYAQKDGARRACENFIRAVREPTTLRVL